MNTLSPRYWQQLIEGIGRGWNRFWFTPIDPLPLAVVRIGGRFGYVDDKGRVAIAPQFDEAHNFFRGAARVRIGQDWFQIDNAGNRIAVE